MDTPGWVLAEIAVDMGQFVHDVAVVGLGALLLVGLCLLVRSEIKDLSRWSERDEEVR